MEHYKNNESEWKDELKKAFSPAALNRFCLETIANQEINSQELLNRLTYLSEGLIQIMTVHRSELIKAQYESNPQLFETIKHDDTLISQLNIFVMGLIAVMSTEMRNKNLKTD